MQAELAYLFRHAVLRDAAYQLQPPAERAHLHALIVLILEHLHGGPPPRESFDEFRPHALDALADELAVHARFGQAHDAALQDRYREYLWRGAREAMRAYRVPAAIEAARLLERDSAPGSSIGIAAAFLLGHALLTDGRLAEAEGPLRRAAQAGPADADSKMYVVRSNVQLVHLMMRLGRLAEAQQTARLLDPMMASLPVSLQISALSTRAMLEKASGDMAAAERDLHQGMLLAEQHGLELRLSEIKGYLAGLHSASGRQQDAETELRQAVELAGRAGQARVETVHRSNLATLLRALGRIEQASEEYGRALALARKVGDRFMEATILGNRANLLGDDRLDEAEVAYRHALTVSIESGDRRKQAHWMGCIAGCDYNRENFQSAARQFTEAIQIARETSDQWLEGAWLASLCLARVGMGQLGAARQDWSAAAALLSARDIPMLQACKDKLINACTNAGVDPVQVMVQL